MFIVDLLFVETLRLIAAAGILLGVSTVVLRFLKQPVERIRLIQISLMTLLATVAIGAAGVVPKIWDFANKRIRVDQSVSQARR